MSLPDLFRQLIQNSLIHFHLHIVPTLLVSRAWAGGDNLRAGESSAPFHHALALGHVGA